MFVERVRHPERLRDRWEHELRVPEWGQADPEQTRLELTDKLGGGLDCKSRLSRAAGSGQRHETRAVAEESRYVGDLGGSAHEARRRTRKVRVRDRLQRREVVVAKLEERDGFVEVL